MAVAVSHAQAYERPDAGAVTAFLRAAARHVPIALVIGLIVGIHIPTLHYYFFGDDFVVLGDINSRAFPAYMRDVLLLRDLTPNWRPLTMLVYWGEYHAFGTDAMGWRIVNLSIHAGAVLVLYALVLSMTKRVFVAAMAALIFGVSASAVHTVTYITALPHVLSEFFLLSTLYALHRYIESGERRAAWYWAALASYILGFLANEGGVVIGLVVLTYYVFASLLKRRDPLDFTVKMAPFGIVAALLVSGLSGCGCQGVDGGFYGVGWHMPRETWVYMSRLAYPVGAIVKSPTAIEWAVGSVVAAWCIFFFVRGPNIARLAAVGLVVGLMPYVPSKMWTATRYTYLSLPFFAILVAVAAGWVHHHAVRLNRYAAHALAAAALVAVGGLYAWQTTVQTQPFLHDTARWRVLADGLREEYPSVPQGTTIYVVDDQNQWTNPYWQPGWLLSVGRALYGKDVAVRAVTSADFVRLSDSLSGTPPVVQYEQGRLVRVTPAMVRGAVRGQD
ncbi:MAG TPA: phospholipid carrier-dependent glycosyltransferase [Dehalococcoidia bacterium]|nr:phospholipid carrier-dependent glycosyltransferase [Dehalococcoidia bacterium]